MFAVVDPRLTVRTPFGWLKPILLDCKGIYSSTTAEIR